MVHVEGLCGEQTLLKVSRELGLGSEQILGVKYLANHGTHQCVPWSAILCTISHYINVRRVTIFQYIVDQPIYKACRGGERRKESPPRQWWWEQKKSLDDADANGANK